MKKIIATLAITLIVSTSHAHQLKSLNGALHLAGNIAQGDDIILAETYAKGTQVTAFIAGQCVQGANLNVVVMNEKMQKIKTAIGYGCNLKIVYDVKKLGKYYLAISAQNQNVIPTNVDFDIADPTIRTDKHGNQIDGVQPGTETGSMEGDEPNMAITTKSQSNTQERRILVIRDPSENRINGLDFKTENACKGNVEQLNNRLRYPWQASDPYSARIERDKGITHECMSIDEYNALPNKEPLKK